ncbi:MAG: hypothetical protein J2P17_21540, partial [Mycobacterium sp.]|nr:hypothetical protein [Mycobacterium sp.]
DIGSYTVIQCKFYKLTHAPAKDDIDSFFNASGQAPFINRIIISITDKSGTHAEDTLESRMIPAD